MNAIISAIAFLEKKQDNGTITMDEEVTLGLLIEKAEYLIKNK